MFHAEMSVRVIIIIIIIIIYLTAQLSKNFAK